MPLIFGFSVYPPCETSLKSCNLFHCHRSLTHFYQNYYSIYVQYSFMNNLNTRIILINQYFRLFFISNFIHHQFQNSTSANFPAVFSLCYLPVSSSWFGKCPASDSPTLNCFSEYVGVILLSRRLLRCVVSLSVGLGGILR